MILKFPVRTRSEVIDAQTNTKPALSNITEIRYEGAQ